MLNRTVSRNESWLHFYQSKSKCASMQGKSCRSTKKFKVTPSAWKVMLTVFWDSQGVLLAHFQNRGEYVNSASYCEVLLKLRDAIRRKRPGQLARRILLHHDNARSHTVRATQERIQELHRNLSSIRLTARTVSDFHLFGPLKNYHGGKRFTDE
jgi:hypothetical protein